MVRQRVSHWSSNRSPEDAALALLALGLVPEPQRVDEATAAEVLAGLREVLAVAEAPARWVLYAHHDDAEPWETVATVEELAGVVREALARGRLVQIECGDALNPADVLDFFENEPESAVLRANGWTFTTECAG